ncbi:MAG: class B sortase [Oscillospiraceae bacterium]|nr:class B sortase [Oscillospiraceae bacterium]
MSMSDEARGSSSRRSPKPKVKKSIKESFFPQKGDSSSEIISKLIVLFSILVLIVCAVILGNYFYQMYEAKQNHNTLKVIYQKAQQTVITPSASPSETDLPSENNEPVPEERPPLTILPAAQELIAINKDTVGYVRIPGCVDEPVVKGTDNDYYLNHNFYDNQRQCGTCFADFRNEVGGYERSDNIILYAHNQKDGTMFGNLDYYRWDPAYWLKNPFIYFNTNYSEDTYVIISSFVINTKPEHDDNRPLFDYQNYINFDESHTYEIFMSEITKRSTIITGVDCNEDDAYLTLSTCSTEWDDSRHILVARKLRDGESAENFDTTKFSKNPNPKWPAIYYKYNGGTYIDDPA